MKVKLIVFGLMLLYAQASRAQTNEVVTNKTVTDLVKAGLDNSIIISKINSSKCEFDVSTNTLIALKKNAFPSDIIKAMVDKSAIKPNNSNATVMDTQLHNAPVLSTLSEVNYYDHKTNAARPLEKAKASMTIKGLGMGNYDLEISNATSPVRLSSLDSLSFLVALTDAQGDPSGWFTLYKADSKKSKRSTVWAKTMSFGKGVTKNVINYSSRKLGDGLFEIIPADKLEKGEYFFMNKGSMGNYAGRAADVFAFGVD